MRRRNRFSRDALDHAVSMEQAEQAGYSVGLAGGEPLALEPWRLALNRLAQHRAAMRALAWMDAQWFPWDQTIADEVARTQGGRRTTLDLRRARRDADRQRLQRRRQAMLAWAVTHERQLTTREREVLVEWCKGTSLRQTAVELGVSTGSVAAYRARIRAKLPKSVRWAVFHSES